MSKIASTPANEDSDRSRSQLHGVLSASAQVSDRLHPKRNPHSWFLFRLFLGFFGAALVLLPLALPESWIGSIFGLALFLVSILLPSELKSHRGAETSAALDARTVLTGAEFMPEFAPPVPVELHVSEIQILAMKQNLQPIAVIPVPQLTSVFLQRSEKSWLLFLHWSGKEVAFAFHGHAAERHAKKAEAAIRNLGCFVPPEKPKTRAASA